MKLLFYILFLFLANLTMVFGTTKPNIILMLSDDQNWSGLSVEMHPEIQGSKNSQFHTPWLKKMASEGMRFSAAYAPSPVCSPTRASLQTGKSPAQLKWTKAAPVMTASDGYKMISPTISKSLRREEVTVAELLQKAGYATAHYGKWHLQGGGPGEHGYHEHYGSIGNEYASKFAGDNPVDIVGMAKRAGNFMKKSVEAGKPFYIQMSWHALHYPENARKETLAKYANLAAGRKGGQAQIAAITEDLDSGVGMVLQALEWLKISNNTYVIYMADNGGGGKRGALRGGKGSLMEGGIRVPMIVKGPGIRANSWCHQSIVGYDWYPTFCDWAQVPRNDRPAQLEGGSLVHMLKNEGKGIVQRPYPDLHFHFPHYQGMEGPHSSILSGNLKLIHYYESNRQELFDLERDLRETKNIALERPEEAAELQKRLTQYLQRVGAQFPTPNPQYDPAKPPSTNQNGKRIKPSKGNKPGKRVRPKGR